MPPSNITMTDFERDPNAAMRAAESGSVFITEDDAPTLVLMTFSRYMELLAKGEHLTTALTEFGRAFGGIELDIPPRT